MTRLPSPASALIHAAVAILGALPVFGQGPVAYSTDVSVTLENLGIDDELQVRDDLAGTVVATSLGLPSPVDLRALELAAQGVVLLVTDIATTLPDGTRIEPRDVIRLEGSSWSLELDGSAAGIPDGVRIDALARKSSGLLVLSFDQSVALGTITAEDEDLVVFDGAGFTLFFDGSSRGFDPALDLDAATTLDDDLVLSFDQAGTIDGVVFEDEDLLLMPADGGAVSLWTDLSEVHPGGPFGPADVDALALPSSLLFQDGFESSDTSAWSQTVGQ